jgi:hypothetical protein
MLLLSTFSSEVDCVPCDAIRGFFGENGDCTLWSLLLTPNLGGLPGDINSSFRGDEGAFATCGTLKIVL